MKLPSMPFQTRTRQLQNPAAAALPQQLRNIEQATRTVGALTQQIDDQLENNAKLESSQAFNSAKRQYIERMSELTTEFRADRSRAPEDLAVELEKARGEIFGEARNNVSQRSQPYLNQNVDEYATAIRGQEVEIVSRLTQSRSVMALQDLSETAVANIEEAPEFMELEWQEAQEAVNLTNLDAPTKDKILAANAKAYVATALTTLLRDDRVEEALMVRGSDAYGQLDAETRAAYDADINAAAVKSIEVEGQADANAVVLEQMEMQEAFKRAEDRIENIGDLTGAETEDVVRDAKASIAFNAFDAMISRGDVETVQKELKSGAYNKILTPEQTVRLDKRISSAVSSGVSGGINYQVSMLNNNIDKAISVMADGGAPLPESELMAARQAGQELLNTYASVGKEPPVGAYDRVQKIERSIWEQRVRNEVITNPQVDLAYAVSLYEGEDSITRRDAQKLMERAILVDRPAALAEDAIGVAANAGVDVQAMPEGVMRDDEWYQWLSTRVNTTMPIVADQFGTYDLSGPLNGIEVGVINQGLKALQEQSIGDSSAFFAAIGSISSAINNPSAERMLWDQLMGDDEVGILSVAAEMASRGFTQAAEQAMVGTQLLASGDVSLAKARDELNAELTDVLGNAYQDYVVGKPGEERQSYNLVREAVTALYAYKLNQNRGDADTVGVDNELFEEAVAEVTGGTFKRNDQTFVMPNPDTTPAQLENWMVRQNHETLPDMYDLSGKKISAEQIDRGWDDRFVFESSGRPGFYYVKDINTGMFVVDKNKAQLTVPYQPDNFIQRGPSVREIRSR